LLFGRVVIDSVTLQCRKGEFHVLSTFALLKEMQFIQQKCGIFLLDLIVSLELVEGICEGGLIVVFQ
jgi:hypothetical protein